MKSDGWRSRFAATAFFGAALCIGAASASPIGGSAYVPFDNGAALQGYFSYSPSLGKITAWDFTSWAYTGAGHEYDSSNTTGAPTAIIISNGNKDEVFAFEQTFTVGVSTDRFELDLVINCHGVANCVSFGAENTAYEIVGGYVSCALGVKCISSGELRPLGLGEHYLTDGYFNLTDPPATLAFNVSPTLAPGFTVFGSGTPSVPEPASLALMGVGIFVGRRLRKRNKS